MMAFSENFYVIILHSYLVYFIVIIKLFAKFTLMVHS